MATLFLTKGALQLLVVDLYKFCQDSTCRGDSLYIWLDALLCRLPGCAVLVVATHGDRFGENPGGINLALECLRTAISEHMENKRKEWSRAAALMQTNDNDLDRSAPTVPSLRICGVMDASGYSTDDLSRLRDQVCSLAQGREQGVDGERIFRSVGQTVPVSWARVWLVMDALHRGADPFVAAQSLGQPVVPVEGLAKHEFVTWEHASKTWAEVISRLKLATEVGGSPKDGEEVLKAALIMREIGGTMLVTCGLVHLNPSWINVLLRALLDHRLVDQNHASWWTRQLIDYSDQQHLSFDELDAVHEKFIKAGRLTKAYVRFLWRDEFKLRREDVFDRMLSTLAIHGAMFPCAATNNDDPHGASRVVVDGDEELMVPARLPARVGDASLLHLETAVSHGVRMQFIVNLYSEYVPAGLAAQFLGNFCDSSNRIFFRTCWNRGAAFMMGGLEYLVCLHDPTDALPCRIEIDIAGSNPETVNNPGIRVRDALVRLLKERYPGLLFKASMDPEFMFGGQAWRDSLKNIQEHLECRFVKLRQGLEVALNSILDACRTCERGQSGRDIDTLVQKLHDLRLNIDECDPQPLGTEVEMLVRELGTKIDRISNGDQRDSERQLLRNVSLDVACLRWPIPRLVCLLPKHEGTLSDDDRCYSSWSRRLKVWCRHGKMVGGGNVGGKRWRDGKKAGGGIVNRRLRLFFLCTHDYSLVECGPNGQGYKVKQLKEWAAKAMPLATVALALASITLKVCTGLSIPADEIDAAFGDSLGSTISDIVEASGAVAVDEMTAVVGGGLESSADGQQLEHLSEEPKPGPAPLDGLQYERLKEVVKRFEFDGVKTKKGDKPFTSFGDSMEFVDKHGEGVHWAWVRKKNVTIFKNK